MMLMGILIMKNLLELCCQDKSEIFYFGILFVLNYIYLSMFKLIINFIFYKFIIFFDYQLLRFFSL